MDLITEWINVIVSEFSSHDDQVCRKPVDFQNLKHVQRL